MLYILPFLLIIHLRGQGGTEVYWAELTAAENGFAVGELTNLSQNPGYDNQPSFWTEDILLYAASREGQTDILSHNVLNQEKEWKCTTLQGSEYSPLRIPKTEAISAIRLDNSGLQRLYRYTEKGESQPLFTELKIGYSVWASPTLLICTVLVDDRMDLYSANLQSGKTKRIAQKVGRSLHKIPNSNAISFIQWDKEIARINSYGLQTQQIEKLGTLPKGVQDMAWLPSGEMIFGKGSNLYRQFPGNTALLCYSFPVDRIQNISRIALSPSGKRIALVGDE